MNKYYGNYLGIVVGSGDDPENRNRIQVWVPHVTNTLYDGWNNKPNVGNIDFFNFQQGNNIPVPEVIDRIRNVLPWAECASPLFGGGSPVTQNFSTGQSSIDAGNSLQYDDEILVPPDLPEEPLPELIPATGRNSNEEAQPVIENFPPITDSPANNAPGSGNDLPPVEPPLPTIEGSGQTEVVLLDGTTVLDANTGEYIRSLTTPDDEDITFPTPATRTDPSIQVTGQTPTEIPSIKAPVVNFNNLYRTATSTARGSCIDDGSTGLCLKGVSVWSYALTKDEYFLRATETNANAINTGRSEYFQDSKLYKDREPLPNNYVPVVGDIVSDKNHIITYLGNDKNGDQVWYSDFKDRPPSYYVENKGWNNPQLIRLNPDGRKLVGANPNLALSEGYFDAVDQYQEESPTQDQSRPVEPDDFAGSTLAAAGNGGYDGTSTGTYSVPDVGSKVWIFFHGGDIQKPVYFAQALDPASFDQTTQGT